jgi:hypothetical protein
MRVQLEDHVLVVAGRLRISVQRTLRVPDDGRQYPLPPGLGMLPLTAMPEETGYMVPMYQREALWIGFSTDWPPFAIQVSAGMVNAVSGRPSDGQLHDDPQDYVVCPEQLWLDGINTGSGHVRQFVAMPLGQGYSLEHAITGKEDRGGIQMTVHRPKPGAEPSRPAPARATPSRAAGPRMGLGAGGKITQKLYPDPHGLDIWDRDDVAAIDITIVNIAQYRSLTGNVAPPSPVDARTYTEHGLPWFHLYEEDMADVPAPSALQDIKTIADRDRERGKRAPDPALDVDDTQIHPIKRRTDA